MADTETEPAQLIAARSLAGEIRSHAAGAETARRQPPELMRRLADAGLFAICVPAELGGGELSARDALRVIEEVSRADGATGWCLVIGATTGVLAASLPDAFAREIYGANPSVITGGAAAPLGRGRAQDGGPSGTGPRPLRRRRQHPQWRGGA